LSSAFVRFLAATIAQCSSDRPVRSRNAFISSPATVSVEMPSGRFRTGSSANASIAPSDRTSDTLLCASTATTDAIPERISIIPVTSPNSPSAATVCTGRCIAPSWSGTYSSKIDVPSSRSSEQQTNESTSVLGSIPASK